MQIKIYFPLEIEEHIVKDIGAECQASSPTGLKVGLGPR